MKRRTLHAGCLLGAIAILLLLIAAAGYLFLRSQSSDSGSPSSPVFVTITAPNDADEVNAGDFIFIEAKAAAPEPILTLELFVDGKPFGTPASSSESAFWTWQAFQFGIHTLSVRAATINGESGYSQTVIVNVLQGSGTIQVTANEGQTLEQIGAGFGAPPNQMADSNPHIDPTAPLKDGQPVQVPLPEGDSGNGSGPGGGEPPENSNLPPLISIEWNLKFTEPVDKSYCYVSDGGGVWQKMPKAPFDFFDGLENLYTQLIHPTEKIVLKADCWGWLAGALKYLGQAQASFDLDQPPQNVTLIGDGFQFIGTPKIPTDSGGGPPFDVPAPYALRESINSADCTAHSNSLLAPFICDTLFNAPLKQNVILEWEWQKPLCWAGNCGWVDAIDGYRLYEIDSDTKTEKYLKEIANPSQKVASTPLPWGSPCYGVRAYVNSPFFLESEMTTYCPNNAPVPQEITVSVNDWLTNGGQWFQDGDCDSYGLTDSYVVFNKKNGFGNQPGQVLVGSYIVDDDDGDCFREGDYWSAVKFNTPIFPPGAVIQKAVLKFSKVLNEYGASGVATNENPFCASQLRAAKQDWSGIGSPIHFWGVKVLPGYSNPNPIASLSGWWGQEVDVTLTVTDWVKHPSQDYGFILVPAPSLHPATDGSGSCLSGVNVQLKIYYFAP